MNFRIALPAIDAAAGSGVRPASSPISPKKVESSRDRPYLRIGPKLKAMMDAAQSEVVLISPYFVPGEEDARYLRGRAQHGVSVKVLTNSLASTDEPAAHSGYTRYRRRLLEGGVDLHELRPAVGAPQLSTARGSSSGISLHAKAMIVDRAHVFIGSLNMDPRSKLLNTEMGLIVDSPELAEAVREFFDTATQPNNAFHVVLRGQQGSSYGAMHMQWLSTRNGVDVSDQSEPGATMTRRIEVLIFRILPIEGLL